MPSKFHKTTSECWQSTSGTQKSNPSLQKKVGKNIKDKKRDKRGRDGVPSWEGNVKKQRHYFANKGPSSQGYGFSSSHIWM